MPTFHQPLPRDNATTIEKAIENIRFDTVENLYIFKNGQQVRRFKGTVNRVTPPVEYFFEMKDSTLVHNHTSGSSFSLEDVKNAVYHDVAKFYLVTHSFSFHLIRPADGWNIDFDPEQTQNLWNSCKILLKMNLINLFQKMN
jgi:hypothetical protein